MTAEILRRKIVIKFQCKFETEVPEIVCILNKQRSKPPALAEKSKYLTINKHGNIALFTIFSFQIQNICILEKIFRHCTTKLLKIFAFWVIFAKEIQRILPFNKAAITDLYP